jgi:transposase
MRKVRFVGLDVHAETIAVAVAEPEGEVRSLGMIPNRLESIRKVVKKLGPAQDLRACYEAGPCGYVLYWQLTELGVRCEVIAPTLVPVKAGDRVKTDRRDAQRLARSYRAGDLTAVWVPDAAHEALRDLVRTREAAKKDQLRARHRLSKLLLRRGLRPAVARTAWGSKYMQWVKGLHFEEPALEAAYLDLLHEVEHAAERIARLERSIDVAITKAPESMRAVIAGLQALRGVSKMTAATLVAEVGQFSRFEKPRQLMGYSGMVSREHSSGERTRRGAITKAGNAHVRRIVIEASWSYRHRPSLGFALRQRQQGLPQSVKEIAWKAQYRLHRRYQGLLGRGLPKQKIVTALARELLGFVWAIALDVERTMQQRAAA